MSLLAIHGNLQPKTRGIEERQHKYNSSVESAIMRSQPRTDERAHSTLGAQVDQTCNGIQNGKRYMKQHHSCSGVAEKWENWQVRVSNKINTLLH